MLSHKEKEEGVIYTDELMLLRAAGNGLISAPCRLAWFSLDIFFSEFLFVDLPSH